MTDNNGEEIPQLELNLEHFWGVFVDTNCFAIFKDYNEAEDYARENLDLLDWLILEIGRKRDNARQITASLGEPDETLAVCGRCGEADTD